MTGAAASQREIVIRSNTLRVAMVLYGDLTFDSRVQREANSLVQAGHSVTIHCLEGSHETAAMLDPRVVVEVVPVRGRRGLPHAPSPFLAQSGPWRYATRLAWLWTYARNLWTWGGAIGRRQASFDVWHAHDLTGLIGASRARPASAALVYDLHDLFVETGTGARLPGPLRRLIGGYERRLVRSVDLVLTVNHGLADHYREHFRPRSMVVVHNCVPAWSVPEPRPTRIRAAVGITADKPVVLYHGLLDRARGLETLYEAILEPGLEQAHLVLLGPGEHRARLRELAGEPRFNGRVHVLEPVSPAELLTWVASADVGAMPMPRTTLNLYLSTPNKLFECLAAGVPVVTSDFPVVRAIVLDDPLGPLGAVCEPTAPREVAVAIRGILDLDAEARRELGSRCAAAARQRWNWESEVQSLIEGYRQIAEARTHAGDGDDR